MSNFFQKFVPLSNFLTELGLKNPNLSVCVPDNNFYHTLLFQPKEIITVEDQHIGCNSEEFTKKCISFLDTAIKNNSSLAIAPEYCLQWKLLEEFVNKDIFPAESNLWALGFESITIAELKEVTKNSRVTWIYEKDILEKTNEGNFLSPFCYLFQTRNERNELCKVIVIQFKTARMGGGQNFERHRLICGNRIYCLQNTESSSIRLVSLICSDVLDFIEDRSHESVTIPYLFIHPQLNLDARHAEIQRLRKAYLSLKDWRGEIITSNWASGTKIPNEQPISFSASGFYMKTKEVNKEDQFIAKNHMKGIYYTFWSATRSQVNYFNSDESIFHFRTTKVHQVIGSVAASRRTGPEMLQRFFWNSQKSTWEEKDSDDGLQSLCTRSKLTIECLEKNDLFPLDKERLATLSCGLVRGERSWFEIDQMENIQTSDPEVIKRITFAQDDKEGAIKHREVILLRMYYLINSIINDSVLYPSAIKDLSTHAILDYRTKGDGKKEYNYNLYGSNPDKKSPPAAVVYIGDATEESAKRTFDQTGRAIGDTPRRRLVVWYRDIDGGIKYYLSVSTKIDSEEESGDSITKED